MLGSVLVYIVCVLSSFAAISFSKKIASCFSLIVFSYYACDCVCVVESPPQIQGPAHCMFNPPPTHTHTKHIKYRILGLNITL